MSGNNFMHKEVMAVQKKVKVGIRNGTIITGKWQQKSYTIIRPIGSGMIGTVYLCRNQGRLYALKLGTNPTALVREVTILKSFNKVRDQRLGPFLFDVDDWQTAHGQVLPFYVMEYIQGVRLESYIKQHGPRVIGEFLLQMLKHLEGLHKLGYVYGDLKNDNLLVMKGNKPIIRFIDVGGVTKMGQSVKEYSGFYDRGYWQLGNRVAKPSYDLFALVMVFLTVYYPKQFRRGRNPRQLLIKKVQEAPGLRNYAHSFRKALDGTYPSARAMRKDVEAVVMKQRTANKKEDEPLLTQAIIITLISVGFFALDFLM